MKRFKVLLGVYIFLAVSTVWTLVPSKAQGAIPRLINFQGILRDGSGNPVPNGSYSVTFRIYDASSGGNVLWMETQSTAPSGGFFNVLLGATNFVPDSAFNDANRYLGITVESDPEMSPRFQLISVGYAFRVNSVDGALGGNILTKVSIGPGNTNIGINAFVAGENNTAGSNYATVSGGKGNILNGVGSTISGGENHFVSGQSATISGGYGNIAGAYSSVGGGYSNFAGDQNTTVGGGYDNNAGGFNATVAGGIQNLALGYDATVGGGGSNIASDTASTIGGGRVNKARGRYSVISGGGGGTLADSNSALGDYSAIGGGKGNIAEGFGSKVGGGSINKATGSYSFVGGGIGHLASGSQATVVGGQTDTASAPFAAVGGGCGNSAKGSFAKAGGGFNNLASGFYSTVAGGDQDTATGDWSVIPGGKFNKAAGNFSFAAGHKAKALHHGAFVWADSTDADFSSTAANQFLIRASRGVGVGTINPQGALDVSSTTGAFIVPRMNTAQRNALTPVNGMIVYNITDNQFNFYENGSWVTK